MVALVGEVGTQQQKDRHVTPYKISTITAVGDVGTIVDLGEMFRGLCRECFGRECVGRVVRAEFDGDSWGEVKPRKKRQKKQQQQQPPTTTKKAAVNFGNQATLVVRVPSSDRRVNVKVFRNGRVQLTGIKRIEEGREVVEHVATLLRGIGCVAATMIDYRVCLINSDFDIGFRVRRDALHRLVRERFPRLSCCYEPCIYPGVRIRYYWRDRGSVEPFVWEPGECACGGDVPCDGKGDGVGRCRKVTMSVFQSGKAIVVGAHTLEQLGDAYRFLVDRVVLSNRSAIELPAAGRCVVST